MKKSTLLMLLSLMLAITACDNLDQDAQFGDVTFSLSTEYEIEVVKSGSTRSSGLTRYIAEIYAGNDLSADPYYRGEQAGGTFTVPLDGSLAYTCLFWADMGTVDDNVNGAYKADSLMNVTLNADKGMSVAFFARYDMPALSNGSQTVILKRPLARVNLIATDAVAANSILTVTYNAYSQFNVLRGEVSGITAPLTRNFRLTATRDTLVSFYTFALAGGGSSDFSFRLGSGDANNVDHVPLRANYSTNIKGEFSFQNRGLSFNIKEIWDGEYNIPLGSTAGYYKTETYRGYGVKIDSLWWAPVNVGYTAANSYGLLFNEGKNIGFEYGTAGNSGRDGSWLVQDQGPCPDGWRIPTKAEFTNLLLPLNSPVDTVGNPGQWRPASVSNPNSHAGRWFGPDCKTATATTPNNSIFFPVAGYLSSNQVFCRIGDTGSYWFTSGDILDFDSWDVDVKIGASACGYSIRCVQN